MERKDIWIFADRLKAISPKQANTPLAQATIISPATPSISDRLSRLGSSRSPVLDENEIASRLNGIRLAEGVIRVDQHYPLMSFHGECDLTQLVTAPLEFLGVDSKIKHDQLVFYRYRNIRLPCGQYGNNCVFVGFQQEVKDDVLHVRQWFLTAFRGEPVMLQDTRDMDKR